MEYVGAEQEMCDLWVRARIAEHAGELNALDTGLSERVFLDFAPHGIRWPAIIFQCQDPPREIRGVGTFAVMVDTLYLVKAVAQASDYSGLAEVAKVLHKALTTSTGNPVGDGTVLTSVRQRQFSMVEAKDGTQYRHLGGTYQIHAQG